MTTVNRWLKELVRFVRRVRAAYPPTVHVTLIWDNWPNHHHAAVQAAAAAAGIALLYLRTYAPWTNPIRKLWLKVDVRYVGLFSDDEPSDVWYWKAAFSRQ